MAGGQTVATGGLVAAPAGGTATGGVPLTIVQNPQGQQMVTVSKHIY